MCVILIERAYGRETVRARFPFNISKNVYAFSKVKKSKKLYRKFIFDRNKRVSPEASNFHRFFFFNTY